ncbi:hypothetical protein ACFQNE_07210 [Gordonia phosphorivorans]|uniref:Uncharacterized protein n=1 Tax=Gordonia phosphorivorans TaxID=1056982 RepID=A0ABV6H4A2_9ACTN
MSFNETATAVAERPFLYERREAYEVNMGGTTASNVAHKTGRASEMGPDD